MNIAHMNAGDLAQMMGHGATAAQAEIMRLELSGRGYGTAPVASVPQTVWAKCLARVPLGTATAQNFKFRPDRRDPDDPTTTRTNEMRANTAAGAVEAACSINREKSRIDEDTISDLLADLAHLCDREGLDYTTLANRANVNWRAER